MTKNEILRQIQMFEKQVDTTVRELNATVREMKKLLDIYREDIKRRP